MEGPVAAQFLHHGGGQGHDAVLVSFAVADEEFVLLSFDVVNGEPETLAQAQTAAVDQFEGSAIAPQTDVGQQIMDLLAGEHGGQDVVIFGLDLREQSPVGVSEEINEEHAGGGAGLADGLGSPLFLEFDEQEVLAELGFGDGSRVAAEVLVDEPELAVVGVPGAIGVVAQSQVIGKLGHGGIGVLVIDGVGVVSGGSPNRGQDLVGPGSRAGDVAIGFVCVR